eukprot:NODE_2781_length_1121_cov_38.855410_g2553_i0.p1 GENE.NODE_2781_length_1121_cov_38.855410_g2553_i0~~NODE_2781_length_1121_cov_38.855410_g2553_i0.p1  ORF type:complete len:309 (+),score=33.44 NODE_2781_length_1121_cov_38.855410_g2553_i0:57-983(+)
MSQDLYARLGLSSKYPAASTTSSQQHWLCGALLPDLPHSQSSITDTDSIGQESTQQSATPISGSRAGGGSSGVTRLQRFCLMPWAMPCKLLFSLLFSFILLRAAQPNVFGAPARSNPADLGTRLEALERTLAAVSKSLTGLTAQCERLEDTFATTLLGQQDTLRDIRVAVRAQSENSASQEERTQEALQECRQHLRALSTQVARTAESSTQHISDQLRKLAALAQEPPHSPTGCGGDAWMFSHTSPPPRKRPLHLIVSDCSENRRRRHRSGQRSQQTTGRRLLSVTADGLRTLFSAMPLSVPPEDDWS